MKFGMGANNGLKTTYDEFEMPTTYFLTYQPDQPNPINNENFCVFHLIWTKFGVGANNGPKTT